MQCYVVLYYAILYCTILYYTIHVTALASGGLGLTLILTTHYQLVLPGWQSSTRGFASGMERLSRWIMNPHLGPFLGQE